MSRATATTTQLEADLEVSLKGHLEYPDVWAKVLRGLAETDSENRTEALLLLQLAQPVLEFVRTIATKNTDPDRRAAQAKLLLAALCPKPSRVTLTYDAGIDEHQLVVAPVFGPPAGGIELTYDDHGMHDAVRDYTNLTEWLRPAQALNAPRDTEA